jgi:hypothetical protein
MFDFSEIQPGDLIKVLVNTDDVEDEMYAIVEEHGKDYLVVKYFTETSMIFKGAYIYILDDETNLLREESVCEHFPDGETLFSCISHEDKMYTLTNDQDSDLDSVICNDSSSDGEYDSFIVSDTDVEGRIELPPDHDSIDKAWREWQPSSPGSSRFKEVVNRIEERAKIMMDNHNF